MTRGVARELIATFVHTSTGGAADALCEAGYGERSDTGCGAGVSQGGGRQFIIRQTDTWRG